MMVERGQEALLLGTPVVAELMAEPLDAAKASPVAVYRARLPDTDSLLPYLRQIDTNRHYANRGPLVAQLETRLRERIAGPGCAVLTAASGTAALQGAILAQAGRATADKPYALIPAHTFVATAMAAEACGYQPLFVDIDPPSDAVAHGACGWAASPERFHEHPALAQAGIVLAVAPYGVRHDQAAWAHFVAASGVPVVIDAAASFEALAEEPAALTGNVPVVVSFHATKSFAAGEGGAVIWSDIDGLTRIAQALNFGFLWRRESRAAGFNGKLSEYHAAIGLAGLDRWEATLASYRQINLHYQNAAREAGLGRRLFTGPTIASNYALCLAQSMIERDAIVAALTADGIEHRFWYGGGVHREPYFADRGGLSLPRTEALADRLIGIPTAPDIAPATIDRVIDCLVAGIAAG